MAPLMPRIMIFMFFFFFNDTATTEIYTLSLHDALPICHDLAVVVDMAPRLLEEEKRRLAVDGGHRSEEHTSELQSPCNLVCRLLLEKKKEAEEDACGRGVGLRKDVVAVRRLLSVPERHD